MGLVNETIVLNHYLQQMELDKIPFLQKNNYLKLKIEQEIIKLRDEDNMHNKIQTAKELWKLLFEAAMTYIDPDKRGYDTLFNYFDEYVNFEELIFASDSFYRDHTLHCLWVYFLGEYILSNYNFKLHNYDDEKKFVKDLEDLNMNDVFGQFITKLKEMNAISEYQDSVRCISALTHDLGYPLKKINKINQCIKKVLPYFGINNYDEFNFKYNEVQQNYIQCFIEILHSPIAYTLFEAEHAKEDELFNKLFIQNSPGFLNYDINTEVIKNITEEEKKVLNRLFKYRIWIAKSTDMYLRYSNDFEQYQHGIMSAFLLLKTVKAFSKMRIKYTDTNNIEDWGYNYKDYMAKWSILTSISDHTSDGYQITSIKFPREYLLLIDELEEFSRISRANQNRQYINEFCKTEIYNDDDYFQIDFIFDNKTIDNLDPERAFKDKCKRFLTVFNIPNLDENLKLRIRFIDKFSEDTTTFTLEIGRKYANIMINNIEQDIPKYLRSNQYYTKERYMGI